MSVGTEIKRIKDAKNNIIQSINKKNVSVPELVKIDQLYQYIDKIQTGYDISDATATSGDIRAGKTAYINTGKITGTSQAGDGIEIPDITAEDVVLNKIAYGANGVIHGRKQFSTYYTGASIPSNTLGNEGDLYFKKQ